MFCLVPGLFGAPLKAISGWLPPTGTQDFDINAIVLDNPGGPTTGHSDNMTDAARYANKAYDLDVEDFKQFLAAGAAAYNKR